VRLRTVTLAGTDADAFVAAVSAAGLTNVSATKLSTGAIRMTHALGGEFRMWNNTGDCALMMPVLVLLTLTHTEHTQQTLQL
jgi:hypothetical protein